MGGLWTASGAVQLALQRSLRLGQLFSIPQRNVAA